MTEAEALSILIAADAWNVEYATSQRKPYDAYMHAAVIADCAQRYVASRRLAEGGEPHTVALELGAWENLVRALEGWR